MRKIIQHLFSQIQLFFQTDIRYLVKGGGWLSISKAVSIAASFFSSIAFANLLPQETYGIYRYLLSVVGILVISTLHGIDSAVTQAAANNKEGSFFLALKEKMKWGALGGIGSLLIAGYYTLNESNTLALLFLIAAAFIPLMEPLYLYVALLNGKKLFEISAKYTASSRIFATTIIILTVFFTTNIFALVLAYFFSNTLARVILLIFTIKKTPLSKVSDPETVSFGKHLSFMWLFPQISNFVDKVLMFHFAGASALAIYTFAFIPFKQAQTALASLDTLAFPKFATADAITLQKTLPKKVLKSYLIVVPLVIAYILTASFFFRLLYPQYMEAVLPSILVMLQLLLFPLGLFRIALTAQKEETKLYISNATYSIVRVVLLFVLVPFFGIYGAIFAIMSTTVVISILNTSLFFRMR